MLGFFLYIDIFIYKPFQKMEKIKNIIRQSLKEDFAYTKGEYGGEAESNAGAKGDMRVQDIKKSFSKTISVDDDSDFFSVGQMEVMPFKIGFNVITDGDDSNLELPTAVEIDGITKVSKMDNSGLVLTIKDETDVGEMKFNMDDIVREKTDDVGLFQKEYYNVLMDEKMKSMVFSEVESVKNGDSEEGEEEEKGVGEIKLPPGFEDFNRDTQLAYLAFNFLPNGVTAWKLLGIREKTPIPTYVADLVLGGSPYNDQEKRELKLKKYYSELEEAGKLLTKTVGNGKQTISVGYDKWLENINGNKSTKELFLWIRNTRKGIAEFTKKLKEMYPKLEIGERVAREKKGPPNVNDSFSYMGNLLLEGELSSLFPKTLFNGGRLKSMFLRFMEMFSAMYLQIGKKELLPYNKEAALAMSKGVEECVEEVLGILLEKEEDKGKGMEECVEEVLGILLEKEEDKGKDKGKEDKNNTEKIYIRYIDLDAKAKAKETGKKAKRGGGGSGIGSKLWMEDLTLIQLVKRHPGKVSGKIDWGDYGASDGDGKIKEMFSDVKISFDDRLKGMKVYVKGSNEHLIVKFEEGDDMKSTPIELHECGGYFKNFCSSIKETKFKPGDKNYPKIEVYG